MLRAAHESADSSCEGSRRASCWHGTFMCEGSHTAGTVKKTAAELRKLNVEHADYYSRREVERVCGGTDYHGGSEAMSEMVND